jgi:hypothetical protein
MDLARKLELMERGGATQDEMDAEIAAHAKALDDPDEDMIELRPEFSILSNRSVDLYHPAHGKDVPHSLRILNRHDFYQILPDVFEIARAFGAKEGKTPEDYLKDGHPEQFLATLFTRLKSFRTKGKYPKWAVAAMELIGQLVSTPERTITASTLIALPNHQHDALILAFWAVNREPFFAWLGTVLPGLAQTLSTLEQKLGQTLKKLNQAGHSPLPDSPGGPESGGTSQSSARSKRKSGSPKAKPTHAPLPDSSS